MIFNGYYSQDYSLTERAGIFWNWVKVQAKRKLLLMLGAYDPDKVRFLLYSSWTLSQSHTGPGWTTAHANRVRMAIRELDPGFAKERGIVA